MTQQEIIEGNKLIAEFMGGIFETNLPFTHTKHGWIDTPANDGKQIAQDYDLKYHSSWDWLMPVIKKIHELDISIDNEVGSARQYNVVGSSIGPVTIESTWQACVEFIKYYNQNKEK
jgi:hypothetical protein